jgi:tetratricopeptide (TPR) repeat protein
MDITNNPAYYNGLGHQCRELGQFSEALANYDKAVRLDPSNMDYYYNRAVCYRKLEQYEKAIQDYSVVIRSDPRDAEAFYERGVCYNRISSPQNAMDDFNNAIRLKPSINLDCYCCRAVAYCLLGNENSAVKDLEYVLERDPYNIAARQMLSMIQK